MEKTLCRQQLQNAPPGKGEHLLGGPSEAIRRHIHRRTHIVKGASHEYIGLRIIARVMSMSSKYPMSYSQPDHFKPQ